MMEMDLAPNPFPSLLIPKSKCTLRKTALFPSTSIVVSRLNELMDFVGVESMFEFNPFQ